jgi:hypothetical protein
MGYPGTVPVRYQRLVMFHWQQWQRWLSAAAPAASASKKLAPGGSGVASAWETCVGLEIHVQIKARAKLFSASSAESGVRVQYCTCWLSQPQRWDAAACSERIANIVSSRGARSLVL